MTETSVIFILTHRSAFSQKVVLHVALQYWPIVWFQVYVVLVKYLLLVVNLQCPQNKCILLYCCLYSFDNSNSQIECFTNRSSSWVGICWMQTSDLNNLLILPIYCTDLVNIMTLSPPTLVLLRRIKLLLKRHNERSYHWKSYIYQARHFVATLNHRPFLVYIYIT